MTRIFISYRRTDSIGHTGRIYDRLVAEFGKDSVFMDVDNIPLGADFSKHIAQEVSKCQVALIIIGNSWTTATGVDGTRRLDSMDDYVRIEVESALQRGIPVIPVLLDGVNMPTRLQLPASLHPLTQRNGVTVGYNPRFYPDMTRLIKGLKLLANPIDFASDNIEKGDKESAFITMIRDAVLVQTIGAISVWQGIKKLFK